MAKLDKRTFIPVVDRRFQFKYTAYIVGVAVIVSAILGTLLLISYWEMNRVMDMALQIPEWSGLLDTRLAGMIFDIGVVLLILEVVTLGVAGLIVTHRVCGPVAVMHKQLAALKEGKYPDPRPLRTQDEFVPTFELLTQVISSLRTRDLEEAAQLDQIVIAARKSGMAEPELAALQRLIDVRRERIRNDQGDTLPYKVEAPAFQA